MVRTLKFATAALLVAVAALAGFDCSVASAQTGPGGSVGSLSQAQIVASFRQFDKNLQVQTLADGSVAFGITMTRKSDGLQVRVFVNVSASGQVYMVTPLTTAKPGVNVQQLNENLHALGQQLGIAPSQLVARTLNDGQVIVCVEMVMERVGSDAEIVDRFVQVLSASVKVLDVLNGRK